MQWIMATMENASHLMEPVPSASWTSSPRTRRCGARLAAGTTSTRSVSSNGLAHHVQVKAPSAVSTGEFHNELLHVLLHAKGLT